MEDLINGRCGWAGTDDLYIKYHDEEWGKPVSDDKYYLNFSFGKCTSRLIMDYHSAQT